MGRSGRRTRQPFLLPAGRVAPAAWLLAALAVLAQSVLFELAMAGRLAADARERERAAAVGHHGHGHGAGRGTPADEDRPAPARHEHGGKDCPFCLARAANPAAGPAPDIVLPAPAPPIGRRARIARGRVAARRRPPRPRSRSPPRPVRD